MLVSSNPPWGREPVQHCDRFYKTCGDFFAFFYVRMSLHFYAEEWKAKFIVL